MIFSLRRMLQALVLVLCVVGPASAVDVSQLSDFEANPCVIALSERNAAKHVDAPDSALADACERAHDSIEVAWDFLTRTWLPRDVTAAAGSTPGARLGTVSAVLALAEILLTYFVLGTPVFAIALALQPSRPFPWRPRRRLAEAVTSLITRILLASVLLAIFALPLAKVLASVVVLIAAARLVRAGPRRTTPPSAGAIETPSAFAEIAAGMINDTVAAIPNLVALSLFSRGNFLIATLGVLLSAAIALPPVLRAIGMMRHAPPAFAAAAVLLVLAAGSIALSDSAFLRVSALGGPVLVYAILLGFGAAAVWAVRLLARRQLTDG